ncbi:cobalamin biosynthesis protein CobD/CbiB [Oceanibaculum indicum]|uniref:Cobalamin biosynthesis protein CobD n=1 Tax=Oceanibaculum indicum P24 TaxID=1207063 RepID=K2J8J5_9PROT|nr:cobalamin biosynthesis protein [Oceanibaculum indicum]EKE71543.1 cobalamin biosynthesis protein CobD [Oceanibaculum indicum P24]
MLLFLGQSTETLILLIAALAIDAYAGGFVWPRSLSRLNPAHLLGRLARWFDDRLNRPERTPRSLRIRSWLALLALLILVLPVGIAVHGLAMTSGFGWALALWLMVAFVTLRRTYDLAENARRLLQGGTLAEARLSVDALTDRDIYRLDEHAVARVAVESLTERFVAWVAAPLLWAALFGLPGLLAQAAAHAGSRILRRGDQTLYGRAFTLADRLFQAPASWLAGLAFTIAAIAVPTARPLTALRILLRDGDKAKDQTEGRALAAMAGALDLSLGGPRQHAALTVPGAWIGSGRARLQPDDVRRALMLYAVSGVVLAGLLAATIVVSLRL